MKLQVNEFAVAAESPVLFLYPDLPRIGRTEYSKLSRPP